MYTAKILSKDLDRAGQRMNVQVEFTDGVNTITNNLPFAPNATPEQIKWRLKVMAAELDDSEVQLNALPVGDVTFPTDPPALSAQQTWFTNYSKLEQVQKLIDLGVLTGTEPKVVTLRNKVRDDFLPAYLNLI